MEKKLSDYIQHYIGCEFEFDNKYWRLFKVDAPKGKALITGHRTTGKDGTKYITAYANECKLILRRLEDITEEQAIELVRLVVHEDEYLNVSTCRHNFTGDLMVQWGLLTPAQRADDVEYFFNATGERSWSAEQFNYLLKQGFDLFGLIPAGFAINAKSLTP